MIASGSLLVLAPAWAATALAVLLTSGRPILYRGRRVGRFGHAFTMLKFRTLAKDAETRLGSVYGEELTRLSRRLYYLTARDAQHVMKHVTYDRLQFQAVGGDLRFAAWVLSVVGRSDSEWKLAPIAARLSGEVQALADQIAAAVRR